MSENTLLKPNLLYRAGFANFEGIVGFSVLPIILADLLGNRRSVEGVQNVMVCDL